MKMGYISLEREKSEYRQGIEERKYFERNVNIQKEQKKLFEDDEEVQLVKVDVGISLVYWD